MAYCSSAGLQGDCDVFRLRWVCLVPPPAHTGDFGLHTPKETEMEHQRLEPRSPFSAVTFLSLDCLALSHNPLSVNHEGTCAGLMARGITKGCTLRTDVLWQAQREFWHRLNGTVGILQAASPSSGAHSERPGPPGNSQNH